MGIKVRIEVTNDPDRTIFPATTLVELSAEGNKLSTLGSLLGHAVNGAVAGLAEDKKGLHEPMGQALCEGLDDDFLPDDGDEDDVDDGPTAFPFPSPPDEGGIPDPQEAGNASYPTVGDLKLELLRFKDTDGIRLSMDVSQHGDTPEEAAKRVFGEMIHTVVQSSVNECTLIADGDFNYEPSPATPWEKLEAELASAREYLDTLTRSMIGAGAVTVTQPELKDKQLQLEYLTNYVGVLARRINREGT